MNYAVLFFLLFGYCTIAYPQTAPDSSSYEVQRQRVNRLLDERKQKFGQYDSSLTKKSGLFGLFKSKGDMQQTIDVLRNIVLTDNDIFVETQKLLRIKDYEKDNYQQLATQYDQQITAYIKTISTLQKENERLKQELNKMDNKTGTGKLIFWIICGIILGGSFVYGYKKLTKG